MAFTVRATTVTHSMFCASVGIVNTKSCISIANSLQTISPHNTYRVELRILPDVSKRNKNVLYDRYIQHLHHSFYVRSVGKAAVYKLQLISNISQATSVTLNHTSEEFSENKCLAGLPTSALRHIVKLRRNWFNRLHVPTSKDSGMGQRRVVSFYEDENKFSGSEKSSVDEQLPASQELLSFMQ